MPTGPMPALQRARKDARVDPGSIVKRAKVPGSIVLAVWYGECGLNRIVVIVPDAGGAKAGAARPLHLLSLRKSVASTQSTRRRASRVRGPLACQPILREYSSPSPARGIRGGLPDAALMQIVRIPRSLFAAESDLNA